MQCQKQSKIAERVCLSFLFLAVFRLSKAIESSFQLFSFFKKRAAEGVVAALTPAFSLWCSTPVCSLHLLILAK